MIAICVDDEPILLDWLDKNVSASPDIERSEKFTDELDALDFVAQHPFDIAFLDIELHDMDGVAVAQRLREINPNCGIIFCTGHASYAVKAISQVLVDGYLLKPIRTNAVQHEIDRLKARRSTRAALLTVDLFPDEITARYRPKKGHILIDAERLKSPQTIVTTWFSQFCGQIPRPKICRNLLRRRC